MYTHTTQKQHLTKKHSRHSSRIARKVSRAEHTKEARERNLAVVQLKQALPDKDLPLQKTIGTQEAHRLLQSGAIQAKLKIGAPNDKYEQEADQVADEVLRMPTPPSEQMRHVESEPVQNQTKTARVIQQIQAREGQTVQDTAVSPHIFADISVLHGGGQPLPATTRDFFALRFGADFSDVRVHTGDKAAETAGNIHARAFTVGRDITFGSGQYAPENAEGKKLLAHELAHVVQQKGSTSTLLQRKAKDLLHLIDLSSNIYLDDPEKVVKFENEFTDETLHTLTIEGRQRYVKPGTKIGNFVFITSAGHKIYFKYDNKIRSISKSIFENNLIMDDISKSLYRSVKAIIPIAKYEALLVMVVFRPDLLLDIAGNIIQGKSPIDENAMREYLAGELFRPLGRNTGSKVTDFLLADILKPAAEEAFKQLAKDGKLEPGKYTENLLVSVFSAQVGKYIAALPADSKLLLQTTNDALRESLGALISKEIGAGVSVVQEPSAED
ncbi:MAG: DUF4157 domain-containing protein [Desulfobulbaceae bacterium]|nr:DUF4157 domain-containing protein [Desulfobulbaceae bacterium]